MGRPNQISKQDLLTTINEIKQANIEPTLKNLTECINTRFGTRYKTSRLKLHLELNDLTPLVYCKQSGTSSTNFKRGKGFHYQVEFNDELYTSLYGITTPDDALFKTFNVDGETYAVSSKGGIIAKFSRKDRMWVRLQHNANNCGYSQVFIKGHNQCLVHILVYRAFNETINDECIGMDIDHIDGNRQNNDADNLQLLTHADNARKRKQDALKRYFGCRKIDALFEYDENF